jgi:hypothetical protein
MNLILQPSATPGACPEIKLVNNRPRSAFGHLRSLGGGGRFSRKRTSTSAITRVFARRVHGLVGTVNQNLLPDELYVGPQGWKVSFPLEPPLKPAVLVKVAIEITPNLRADPSIRILRGDKCCVMARHEIELQGSTAFE